MRIAILVTLLSLAAGCTETNDLETGDIEAHFKVIINGEEGRLECALKEHGKEANLELSGGDALVASVDGGADIPLSREAGDFYGASIPVDSQMVVIRFERTEKASAELSVPVTPPADITSPSTFSQQDDEITVTWSNPAEGADVTVFAESCADFKIGTTSTKETIPDEGSYTFTKAELEEEAGFTADCAQLQLLRRIYDVDHEEGLALHYFSVIQSNHYQNWQISLTP